MVSKVLCLLCVLVCVSNVLAEKSIGRVQQAAENQPLRPKYQYSTTQEEYSALPVEYNYQYNIGDESTGDYKTQHEERQGDSVKGSYSLIEPDGSMRIVEYTADNKHGFKVNIRREPTNIRVPVYTAAQPMKQAPTSARQPAPAAYQTDHRPYKYVPRLDTRPVHDSGARQQPSVPTLSSYYTGPATTAYSSPRMVDKYYTEDTANNEEPRTSYPQGNYIPAYSKYVSKQKY